MENSENTAVEKKRGAIVYVLPNLFTTANLFLGFFSIVASTRAVKSEQWIAAAVAIMIAAIADGIDGRIARLTKTESLFGEQYDSMSDLVSFGVAPAILVFEWGLSPYGKFGWMAAFLFLTCAALRLTRFNVLKQSDEKRYFQGLPSPVAASIAASAVLFHEQVKPFSGKDLYIIFVMVFLAITMVSTIRYRSFKDIKIKSQEGFGYLLIIIMILMLVTMEPEVLLFPVGALYLVSGPIGAIMRKFSRQPEAEEAEVL
ncbi:MAG: CDP-diacylglycerol--serine O-phosphatidyltransferase [Bdellovibrionota bacterium]